MNSFTMTTPIASRTLLYEAADGNKREISLELGTPSRVSLETRDTWCCPFQIDGFGERIIRAIYGIDAMQALVLALHILPAELRALARDDGGRFLNEADLGLEHACRVHLEIVGEQIV